MKLSSRKKKWILGVIATLVILHLTLPFAIVAYVNKILKDIPGYTGSVEWIHVNLFRGAYQIHDLNIQLASENVIEPFFSSKTIDVSLEWKALLNGEIVGELVLTQPKLIFIAESESDSDSITTEGQSGENVDWTQPIKDLMPLSINRFEIINGEVHFKDLSSSPEIDIFTENINALATNLSNANSSSDELPSELKITATSIGGGLLDVNGGLNILQATPSFDIDLSFEQIDLTALNSFLEAYLKVNLAKGTLDFYSEFSGVDGELKGYVKPLLKGMKFIDWEQDKKKPLRLIWEAILGFTTELFENQKKDQFATKVPLEGRYDDVNANILKTIGGILENAFIRALKEKPDKSIELEDAKD